MSHSNRASAKDIIAQLRPTLDELEQVRLDLIARKAKAHRAMAIAGLVWFLIMILFIGGGGIFALVISLAGFGVTSLVIYSVMVGKRADAYRGLFKQQVFTQVTKLVQPDMHYNPSRGISKSLFQSAGLVKSRIDRYAAEDLFYGNVGETEVHFSEVKAERKDTTTDSKGNTRTTWVTVFNGVFFMADFHKNFTTWATVTPDFAEKTFGWLGKKLQNLGGSIVRLENPEFENAFVVRGGDQVQVRYILTPDMQSRLLDLRATLNRRMMLAFKDSKVIMLFDVKENWFEPNISQPAHEAWQISKFIHEMQTCCSIVEDLNLNTRIWTK